MAKFDFFGLFKKKKDTSKKGVSIHEMSFADLMQKYNELTQKRAKLGSFETEQIEKLDAEIKVIYEQIMVRLADKNNAEAQAFAEETITGYIEASKQIEKIKKRISEINKIHVRLAQLSLKSGISKYGKLTDEESIELSQLENSEMALIEELTYLQKKEYEYDNKLIISDITLAKFNITSPKLEVFKQAEKEKRLAEIKQNMRERAKKIKNRNDKSQNEEGAQPGALG